MTMRLSVIVFDVNETLSDMAPMTERFIDVGAPGHLARLWFASLLRDGFALAAAGAHERFIVLGRALLHDMLARQPLNRDLAGAAEHIMAGFAELSVHPDVPEGVRALRAADQRLVTLSNGSTAIADRLLTDAGLRREFETLLTADDVGIWKPAAAAYAHAARACGTEQADMLMVAVHPWDTDGAARAGMATAWINRGGGTYPDYFTPPSYTVATLPELAQRLAGDG